MTLTQRSLPALVIICLFAIPVSGQVSTGTPPFGSFGGGPDIINLANLNAHIAIPVLHKAGRGTSFTYDLSYDSSVWYPVNSGGTTSWQPVSNFGWRGQTEAATGYITYQASLYYPEDCTVETVDNNFVYHDSFGSSHSFGGSISNHGCDFPTSQTLAAHDASGLTLAISTTYGNVVSAHLTNSFGAVTNPPLLTTAGAAIVTDRNGNQLTVDGSGHFYDTLSSTAPVLTISGSGTATSPMKFAYTAPSGASPFYQVNYTNYTVATNFGISGIHENKSLAAVPLVTSIVLPDGSQYSFTYEPTPTVPASGACTPYSGTTCVTARVTKVILPTGGTITYSYTGGNNGILSDGTAAILARTTPDGTWTYAHSESGSAWTTLITDPQSNQTNMSFQGIYETQRQVYQGSVSPSNLLETVNTCYNSSTAPCTGTAITLPIMQRGVAPQFPSGLGAVYIYNYNSAGGLTNEYDHDFGPGGSNPLIRETDITFAPLGNITAFRQQVTVKNGSGTIVSQTNYNYDETTPTTTSGVPQHTSVTGSRGDLTSVNYPVSGLTSHFRYYDTGTPYTSQDVNGATTTYKYSSNADSCQMAFPTGITEAISTLTQSYTWNCTGGVQLTAVDENSQTITTTYNDLDFWRPASVTDQLGNQTGFYYQPNPTYGLPFAVASTLNFNNGNSQAEDLQYKDGLGRTYVDQRPQSPGSSSLDSVSYTYDSNGRPYSISVPCVVGAAGTCSTPKTTQTYDTLNRPLVTTDGGGGTVTNTYSQNDVLVTIGPASSGENTKRRQLEYDALGRLTSVCEITALSGSGTCGQTNAQPGYWTKYAYDALGDLTGVTQNAQPNGTAQTRSYSYDGLGRLTSETNPETSATTYVYDSDSTGNCNWPSTTYYGFIFTGSDPGDLVKKTDNAGNITCYQYDALHRLTGKITPYGPYYCARGAGSPCTSSDEYFVYDSATVNSTTMANVKGRLAEAYTCAGACSAKITDEGFSYTARGELTDSYELTPHSPTSYYHVSQTYWPNGAPNVLGGNIGLPTAITYGVDGEGRTSTTSASSGQNPITSTTYNIFTSPNQLTVTFGSGDSDVFGYDPNTMRMNKYQFKIGAQTVTGTLGWNSNGSLGSLNISDPFSTANTQNCTYAADDLARINQVNCGTIWGQNFTYDPFGNITKNKIAGTGATSFTPTYQSSPSITNRVSSVGGVSASYDANGNSLNDTFRTATWDADSNPVTIGAVSLTYDAFDRMVEQSVSGTNSEIVYSPAGVKLALMSSASLTKAFVPLTGGATAVYNSSGLAYYRHADHLGSSRFASTPSRTLYSDTAYSPFGEPYASSGAIDNSFTGQNQDTTAGLYDFQYREHDPNQSRWTSPDPAGVAVADPTNPQSWNRYGYALNNPLGLVDPTGLYTVCMGGFTYDQVDFSVDGQYDSTDDTFIGDPCGGPSSGGLVGPGGGGGGGGVGALGGRAPFLPSLTPSQLQQSQNAQCQQAAAHKAQDILGDSVDENLFLPLKRAGQVGVNGAIIGCLVVSEAGCVEGAVPGAIVGAMGGLIEGSGETMYRNTAALIRAIKQYNTDIAACSGTDN